MRTLLVLGLVLSLGGCRKKAIEADAPVPNRDPYRDVTPAKIKEKVDDIERKREERMDKLQENAK